MNNCIWAVDGSGSLAHREMFCDTSTRTDQKRPHQWGLNESEQHFFANKKQVTESDKVTSGATIMNDYLFGDTIGQIGDCLFGNKPDKNITSTDSASLNTQKKCIQDEFQSNPFIALSMSQAVENPLCLYSSIPKLKGNNVPSDNCLPEFPGNSFCHTEVNELSSTTFQSSGLNLFLGPHYSKRDENNMSMATEFDIRDKNSISVGKTPLISDGNMNQYCGKINNNMLSTGQSFFRVNYNVNTGRVCEKENGNVISGDLAYSKRSENLFAADPFYSKVGKTYMSSGSAHNKENANALQVFSIGRQQDAVVGTSIGASTNNNPSILSMVSNCRRGEQTTISFGGFEDDPKSSDTSSRWSYDIMLNQSSMNPGLKDAVEYLNAASSIDCTNKNKEQKITKNKSSNNFPTNVKSLLSTGILDGVPVKYVSWAREKNLRGVICGTGYLCGCQDCKLSKSVNAFEFERHAGCKTKHPNNHIYFENGKTIYAVVQELKNTPQDMLFEVMQNVVGSPINQKKFDLWKASYQAASRELRRIYGSDGLILS